MKVFAWVAFCGWVCIDSILDVDAVVEDFFEVFRSRGCECDVRSSSKEYETRSLTFENARSRLEVGGGERVGGWMDEVKFCSREDAGRTVCGR